MKLILQLKEGAVCRLSNFFPFQVKDSVSCGLRSHIVCLCQCCDAMCVEKTCPHIHKRISDHKGISVIQAKKPSNPSLSSILSHHRETDHPLSFNDFSILSSFSSSFELSLQENILNKEIKPSVNSNISSFSLSLFQFIR